MGLKPADFDDAPGMTDMLVDAIIRLRELAKSELWHGHVDIATQIDQIADQLEDAAETGTELAVSA